MTDETQKYPTWGDFAREQVRRAGMLYFADVEDEIRYRLDRLSVDARQAFALSYAHRLMCRHEQLPQSEQRPFTLSWRPVLDAMWIALTSPSPNTTRQVDDALEAYYTGPFNHNQGQDGPDDADEDAAAASIHAAECFRYGETKYAMRAASRAVDVAFKVAQDELEREGNVYHPDLQRILFAKEAMSSAVQAELRRQLNDLDALERYGVTTEVLAQLKGGS